MSRNSLLLAFVNATPATLLDLGQVGIAHHNDHLVIAALEALANCLRNPSNQVANAAFQAINQLSDHIGQSDLEAVPIMVTALKKAMYFLSPGLFTRMYNSLSSASHLAKVLALEINAAVTDRTVTHLTSLTAALNAIAGTEAESEEGCLLRARLTLACNTVAIAKRAGTVEISPDTLRAPLAAALIAAVSSTSG